MNPAESDPRRSPLAGTRGRILELLRRGDHTVAQLAEALGLTPNGVRVHLAPLLRDHWIEARGLVPGVSRSFRLYGLSERGRGTFSRASETLLRELLGELIRRQSGARVRTLLASLGRRMGRGIVRHAAAPVADRPKAAGRTRARPSSRLAIALRAWRGLGGAPFVEQTGDVTVVRLHHCPLGGVVAAHPEVCAFGHGLMTEILGAPVEGRCTPGERASCRFEIPGG